MAPRIGIEGYGWLAEPAAIESHVCDTPRSDHDNELLWRARYDLPPIQRAACVKGSVWRCHCGQHWGHDGRYWWPIRRWTARRMIRKHKRRQRMEQTNG
jgi:hypothetical protein